MVLLRPSSTVYDDGLKRTVGVGVGGRGHPSAAVLMDSIAEGGP